MCASVSIIGANALAEVRRRRILSFPCKPMKKVGRMMREAIWRVAAKKHWDFWNSTSALVRQERCWL